MPFYCGCLGGLSTVRVNCAQSRGYASPACRKTMDGMRNDPERGRRLKQQLPYPYNQDLSKVLRGLKRRNPIGRRRQANDPVTAAYLAAAMRLIQRHLGPGAGRRPADPADADSVDRPMLCYWDMTKLVDTPTFRLGLIAAAEAEGDPVVGAAISGRHQENGPLWKDFYQEILRSRDLRLRPGITLDDCSTLLAAIADGLALRALADPDPRIIDRRRRRSLLGTAALVVIAGSVQRADGGNAGDAGLPLEDTVRAMMSPPLVSPPLEGTETGSDPA